MTPIEAPPVRSDSFRPVLGATVLLVLALLAIAGLKSSRDLEAARSRERLLEKRIAETRAESERLRVRIDRLRNDPGMLERLAREDLGMVRPGDVIIELPVPGAAPKPPVPLPPAPQSPQFPRSPQLPQSPPPVPPNQTIPALPTSTPAAGSAGPAAPLGPASSVLLPAAAPPEPG